MGTNDNEYKEIPIHLIDPPKRAARLSIDQEEVKALADDIKVNGLLQAIVLRPENDRYEVVAGHRRFLAVMRLGHPKIMAHVKNVAPKDVAIMRASENLQRVNITPIEEALEYKDLIENHAMTYESIADRLGRSPGTIKRRVDLLEMPEEMRNALHANKVSVGVAESLIKIKDRTALSYYLGCAIDNGITVMVARQWATDWEMAQIHKANDVKPGDSIPSVFLDRPVYVSCDTCGGPEDVNKVKMIRICAKCLEEVKKVFSK